MSGKVLIFSLIVLATCQFIRAAIGNNNALQAIPGNSKMSQTIRRHLNTKYAHEMAEILNGSKMLFEKNLQNFASCLINSYEKLLVESIFASAIDEMINFQTPDTLATSLRRIYQPGNAATFEVMVQAQLHLYRKFKERHDVNDSYMFNIAYYLSQIRRDPLYQRLPNEKRRRVEAVLTTLPSSLQYLFFKPNFCLKNKAFPEFIYTTVDMYINDAVKYIFTWHSPSYVDEHGKWVPMFKELLNSNSNGTQLNLKVALKSVLFNKYLYMEPNVKEYRNIIASWRLNNVPATSDWSVQLVDDELVFEQNGHLMCAIRNLYDDERRFVYGLKNNDHTPFTHACQWRAGECQ